MVLSCCSTASCYCSLIALPLYSHDESHLSVLYDIHSSPCIQMVQVQVLMRTLSAVSIYRNAINICFAMKLNLYNVKKNSVGTYSICAFWEFIKKKMDLVPSGCQHTYWDMLFLTLTLRLHFLQCIFFYGSVDWIISERISHHQFELKASNNKSLQCKLWWSS